MDGVGELRYSYDPEADNLNGRTIQGFSVTALFEMRLDGDGGEYFEIFQKYVDYYGTSDYGNQWVTAALTNGETTLERGNANFEDYADDGREGALICKLK